MSGSKLQFSRDNNELLSGPKVHSATFVEEVDSLRLTLRGRKLTMAIAFVAGTGFTLFGCEGPHIKIITSKYDNSVTTKA
jgi:hypothetical protein